jgi:hypothetical protein
VPLDEVKAGNNISAQLKKLMLPQIAKTAAPVAGFVSKLGFSLAKSA